ncbi:MAG: dTDP-4-dehydrorhamnose reductase [Chloroflexi bacterium]|uniref:dTDP-4-dehydrorhamnose reductase n=1 Tax=Candidatus Chlorohelix allophototropha TaxID=3003348 RepID=A0A8T7LZQ9_9CHLR|nr:dTDP-4-dehydrorhamnose reductase [Chloroflexota bacterium]WJW66791.1 dTDP-4-dehydrorhamnose reductase [Chloroflexota bacterium L227-S17]
MYQASAGSGGNGMRVVVTGINGQLGSAVLKAAEQRGFETWGMSHEQGDITNRTGVMNYIMHHAPDLVIHPAAYTYVDQCESDPDTAYRVNALGTQNLALACAKSGATLLYVSTNCVFDGEKPYPYEYYEYDATNPTSVYGRSKLAGEWYTSNIAHKFYVVRTAWVFGSKPVPGKVNFVQRMLQIADERGSATVVEDERSNPTYAPDLAEALLDLAETEAYGIYHLTNTGVASRYEFAQEIFRLSQRNVTITPTSLKDFKRPTPPLYNSALKNFAAASLGVKMRTWQEALEQYIREAILN